MPTLAAASSLLCPLPPPAQVEARSAESKHSRVPPQPSAAHVFLGLSREAKYTHAHVALCTHTFFEARSAESKFSLRTDLRSLSAASSAPAHALSSARTAAPTRGASSIHSRAAVDVHQLDGSSGQLQHRQLRIGNDDDD